MNRINHLLPNQEPFRPKLNQIVLEQLGTYTSRLGKVIALNAETAMLEYSGSSTGIVEFQYLSPAPPELADTWRKIHSVFGQKPSQN